MNRHFTVEQVQIQRKGLEFYTTKVSTTCEENRYFQISKD